MFGFTIFLLCLCLGLAQVEIKKLHVPDVIVIGVVDDVVLDCDFEVGDERNIVVKWFWNGPDPESTNILLYQWIPKIDTKGHAMIKFKDAIDVDYKASNDSSTMYRALHITKLSPELSGNYTCHVSALLSDDRMTKPLTIYAPPTIAKLKYYPSPAIKGSPVTLECIIDYPGYPDNVTYIWYRGRRKFSNIRASKWDIQHTSLDTRNNFTCIATNGIAESTPKTISLEVFAPPTFINRLNPYKGFPVSSKNVSLTCKIECYPLCSIKWYHEGLGLDNNPLYHIINTEHPADHLRNDFESIESTLIWNIASWPNHQLNKNAPLTNYTCVGTQKKYGISISSTAIVGVDVPPENRPV